MKAKTARQAAEDAIREALIADPRTSHVIGEAVGMHPVSIRRFKGGEPMDPDSLERLATVLGLKIESTVKKIRK